MSEARARRAAMSFIFFAAALFSGPTARAIEGPDGRDKTLPCRPTIACTADFVPPGTFELETGALGEAYYFSDAAPVAPRDGGFLFAFTHSPRSWLVFDVGADVGWFPSARAYSLFVGASVIPAILWRAAASDIAPHGSRLPAYGAIM